MTFPTYSNQVLQEEGSGAIQHFNAAEDVKQGQLVKADTGASSRGVEPSDTDGENAVGFALYSRSSGSQVAVATNGTIVRATSGTGSISSGDFVASHGGTGEEGEVASAASGDNYVGVALQDDTGSGTEGSVIVYVNTGLTA